MTGDAILAHRGEEVPNFASFLRVTCLRDLHHCRNGSKCREHMERRF